MLDSDKKTKVQHNLLQEEKLKEKLVTKQSKKKLQSLEKQ